MAHYLPRRNGELVLSPICGSVNWAAPDGSYEEPHISVMRPLARRGIEVFWSDMDPQQWYPKGFPEGTGTWEPDPAKYPRGLKPVGDAAREAGGDVIGVDWRLDMSKVVEQIDPSFGIQGNIDPVALFAPDDALERMVVDILEAVGTRPGHVFNLGHGIHKTTDPEKARTMIRLVHEHSARIRGGA